MTSYDSPSPITADLDLQAAEIRVTASDRTDTTIDVQPAHPNRSRDVRAAEETTVEFTDGRLRVRSPRDWRRYTWRSWGAVRVTVGVPTGSQVQVRTGVGTIECAGTLGIVTAHTGMGTIRAEHTGELRATSSHGDIVVDHVTGNAGLVTANGSIRARLIDGDAATRTSNGSIELGTVIGGATLKSANGNVVIDRAGTALTAKTSSGNVRAGCVTQGTARLETSAGNVEAAIAAGTAAWLDLHTSHGIVRNELQASAGPEATGAKAEITARTSVGNITVSRA